MVDGPRAPRDGWVVVSEPAPSATAKRDAWLHEPERGSAFGISALLAAHRVFGRGFAVAILHVVALCYALFSGRLRAVSRAYLVRALGRPPRFRDVVRHVATFAVCSFDRVLFAAGKLDGFTIERHGHDLLAELAATRTGAILLGAHLGSFEAMRAMGQREALVLNVLVHFRNARKITAMLRRVAPDFDARIIEIDPDAPHHVLAVAERIAAGELVAVLGDRVGLGEGTTRVTLLGGEVELPTGPYALAAVLRCPIYLTFGLYHGRGRYSLHCERFAESVQLPRRDRAARVGELAQRYAARVEHHVAQAPYCWFNFFDMWTPP